jgi:hypothetical protein
MPLDIRRQVFVLLATDAVGHEVANLDQVVVA